MGRIDTPESKGFVMSYDGVAWWGTSPSLPPYLLQVWRWVCGRLVCLDLKDTLCSSLLIYNFRVFERRFGTRKFAVSSVKHCPGLSSKGHPLGTHSPPPWNEFQGDELI